MLFTGPSIWTMVHGVGLGGVALLGLAASLFYLYAAPPAPDASAASGPSRALARLTMFTAIALWLTVIVGTYVVFPPYRATPLQGTVDLSPFPRSLLQANAETAWLHAFAMESKEHLPWIAAMLATAVAFVCARYRSAVLTNGDLRGVAASMLAISFVLVSFVSLMGVFVNKVAPLF